MSSQSRPRPEDTAAGAAAAAGSAASAPEAKRPRHFHKRPNQHESDAAAAAAATVQPSRGPQLHRHALESVFACLTLRELNRSLAVSRDWLAAVGSMRSIGATVLDGRLDDLTLHTCVAPMCASLLARHIGTVGSRHIHLQVGRWGRCDTAPDLELLQLMAAKLRPCTRCPASC